MSPLAIRQQLQTLLKDDLVYFLQKILRSQYRPPPGFPAMPDLNRAIVGILRELRVYARPADRDYGAVSLMERWFAALLEDGPLSVREVFLYSVQYRGRLYAFSPDEQDRPYLFRTERNWIRHLLQGPERLAARAGPAGLPLHAIYTAEERLTALLRDRLCESLAPDAAGEVALTQFLQTTSRDFTRRLHESCEEFYRDQLAEQARERSRMQAESDHMERELRHAARVQSRAIQRELPADPRLHFALWYEPFHTIGGDYYRVQELEPDVFGIFLADISGHGISAAMHFHTLVNSFERCADALHAPDEFLSRMNSELYGQLHEQFITAIYIRIDLAQAELSYCNGGHPKAFLAALPGSGDSSAPGQNPGARPDESPASGTPKKVRFLRPNGKVLGAFPRVEFQSQTLTLDARNRLIVYTDGISEAAPHSPNDAGFEMLGERGLLDLFDARTTGWSPERTLGHVRTRVDEFVGGTQPTDDRTLLLMDLDCNPG